MLGMLKDDTYGIARSNGWATSMSLLVFILAYRYSFLLLSLPLLFLLVVPIEFEARFRE